MGIVYNSCYGGGFGLSEEAQKLYLEKKGHTPKLHKGKYSWERHYYIDELYDVEFEEIDRSDPVLVEVVRELGDKASDEFAKLLVKEASSGTLYRIEEYDGLESVYFLDEDNYSVVQ